MTQISVLVPCYNEAPYIEGAVQSVVTQTFTDWELIIVDDGSTDSSSVVLDKILNQYSSHPISVFRQRHQGCAAATDQAVRLAGAPLCTILDGDDTLKENSLSVIVAAFQEHPEVDYIWTRYQARSEKSTRWKEGRSKALPPGKTLKEALLGGWWGALAQRSFRRKVYLETGGLDKTLPYVVDQQLAMLFARNGNRIMHLPVVTYYHLQHSKQMSAQHYRDQQRCRGVILERLGGCYVSEK